MASTKENYQKIGERIEVFCLKYNLPFDNFFDILNDQKVVPMLRGKGMEYNAFITISLLLDPNQWTVHKLNPNPNQGRPDQDISVIHKKSSIRLGIESKSAVRGSMTLGLRTRIIRKKTHFKVKCHRSRSNLKKVGKGNDRYRPDDFDVIVTTPSNSLFKGATISDSLEFLDDTELGVYLSTHYNVQNIAEKILDATDNDWRFVLPSQIVDKDGFIQRTPYVHLTQDPNWQPMSELQTKLEEIVQGKWDQGRKKSRN